MAEGVPPTKTKQLASFTKLLEQQKTHELAVAASLLGNASSVGSDDVTTQLISHMDARDTVAREENRQEFKQEINDTIGLVLGGGTQQVDRDDALLALAIQGDHLARSHRAKILRNTSLVRRIVHTATRRRSHGQVSGYFDRRIETRVIDLLKRASS